MRLDKRRAVHQAYRIPERTLFRTAWLGGAWGIYISMRMFHHKTRQARFVWGVPLIGVLQLVCGLLLYMEASRDIIS